MFKRISTCRRLRDDPEAENTITQAVIWAIAIISTAWILGDSEHASTVNMMLVGFAAASVVSRSNCRRPGA